MSNFFSKRKMTITAICSAAVLSVLLLLTFSLTGCKSKTKVSILFHKAEVDAAFQKLIKLYNSKNPDVHFEAQSASGGGDYEALLQSKINGNGAQLVNLEGRGNLESLSNRLEDLSEYPVVKKLQQVHPDILKCGTTSDGKIKGSPVAIEAPGYIFNADAFSKAGVNVNEFKTFEDMVDGCAKLKSAIDAGQLKNDYPNATSVAAVWLKAPWGLTNHELHAIVGHDFKDELEAYKSSTFPFSWADQYKKIVDFLTDYAIEGKEKDKAAKEKANLNTVEYTPAVNKFLNGQCFLLPAGTFVAPSFEEFEKNNKKNLMDKMSMFPRFIPGEEQNKFSILAGQLWAVVKDATKEQKKAISEFLLWMYTDAEAQKIYREEMRMVSPLTSSNDLKSIKYDKITQPVVDAYARGDYIMGGQSLVRREEWTMQCVGTALQEYVAGKIPFDEVVSRAKDGWSKLYKEQVESKQCKDGNCGCEKVKK